MKARWQALKKRHWDERKASERRIITLGAWTLAPLLAYFLLWQPAHIATAKLRAGVPVMRVQAATVRVQAVEAEMLRHRPQPAVLDAAALKTAIEESALRHRMRDAISTLDAQQPDAVRIALPAVAFDQWLDWLRGLQQEQHIRAESVGISALPQPGMVKVVATLTNNSKQ